MKGFVSADGGDKLGVVAVVYATTDKENARKKTNELLSQSKNPDDYYMVYSVPLETDLTTLARCPSIAISKEEPA